MKRIIIVLSLLMITVRAFSTAQFADILIVKNDTFLLFANPLEQYLDYKKVRMICGKKLRSTSTACYRGYQATWKIENDSLFLISINIGCRSCPKNLKLKKEFKTEKVFASWVTDTIMSPRGKRLIYVHMGYGSLYEREVSYEIINGKIINSKENSNIEYDNTKLIPNKLYLEDTITQIIYSNIDSNIVNSISEEELILIEILFNDEGTIESVYPYGDINITENDKLIAIKAGEALVNFPGLMKIKKSGYQINNMVLFLRKNEMINYLNHRK